MLSIMENPLSRNLKKNIEQSQPNFQKGFLTQSLNQMNHHKSLFYKPQISAIRKSLIGYSNVN